MKVPENISKRNLNELVQICDDTATVFLRFGIDYCCNGKQELSQILKELNGRGELLEKELIEVIDNWKGMEPSYSKYNPDELIKYIQERYHSYFHLIFPLLHEYGQFALKGGILQSEIQELVELFSDLKGNVNRHLYKEENIIFPYIHNLTEAYNDGLKIEIPVYKRISDNKNFIDLENIKIHDLLRKIKNIVSRIQLPEGSNKAVVTFITKLNELEVQICGHLHLMNNVLFPKCEEMEKAVTIHS